MSDKDAELLMLLSAALRSEDRRETIDLAGQFALTLYEEFLDQDALIDVAIALLKKGKDSKNNRLAFVLLAQSVLEKAVALSETADT